MKKKVITCMLALTMVFALTACGNENNNDNDTKETSKTERQEDKDDEEVVDEDFDEEELNEDSEEETVTVEQGTVDGNVYTNESLGIQATIPEGFVLYTDEQMQEVLGVGTEMMEAANYDVDALEEGGTLYEVMASAADGSNVQIVIENTEVSAGMKVSVEQYAKILEKNLKTTYEANGIEVEDSSITEENKNGLDCQRVYVTFAGVTQEYYITEIDGYMVSFAATYTETEPESIQQFFDSITAI